MKPGYKQTDVGCIPEDWEATTFVSHGSVIDGDRGANYPGSRDFASDGHCLFLNAGNVTKVGFRFSECSFISRDKDERLSKGKLNRDDIVLTTRGTVGNFAHFDSAVPFEHVRINSGMVILRKDSAALNTKFLYALLQSHLVEKQIERLTFGSAQPQLTVKVISEFAIVVPPIPEQHAIAEALSDVDVLLDSLDRLITKKRNLKQATMQQLLSGQTRLPGFREEWKVKRLEEIGEISGAGVDKKIRPNETPVRLLNYMDIYKKDFLKSVDFEHEVSARPDQVRRCAVQRGDVFFTPTSEVRDDIGHSAVAMEDIHDVVYSYHVVRLRITENWDLRFRAYVFKTKHFMDQASTQCEGSGTRYVITLPKFRSMTIKFPTDIKEQTAIATVLSGMDAELAALEARRDKTLLLKQGMMQELLTGRIRLIKTGGCEDA